eukprot:gene12574-26480_t
MIVYRKVELKLELWTVMGHSRSRSCCHAAIYSRLTRRRLIFSLVIPVVLALWLAVLVQLWLLDEGILLWPFSFYTLPVPLLSIALTMDPQHYLLRLLRSIDHPVDLISILVGNEEDRIIKSIIYDVDIARKERPHLRIELITTLTNPGCAYGWNVGLRAIRDSPTAAWGMLLNSDIAFYPGTLARFSIAMERAMSRDRMFGVGFPSLCCGGQWSAFAVTQQLVRSVGLCDENIFPMFYEDNDYSVRIRLAGYRAKKFKYIPLLHGQYNGRKKYESGTVKAVATMAMQDQRHSEQWASLISRGKRSSESYLVSKWGFYGQPRYFGCKTVREINEAGACNATFTRPFNGHQGRNVSISSWTLDETRRRWIESGEGPEPFRVYGIVNAE